MIVKLQLKGVGTVELTSEELDAIISLVQMVNDDAGVTFGGWLESNMELAETMVSLEARLMELSKNGWVYPSSKVTFKDVIIKEG